MKKISLIIISIITILSLFLCNEKESKQPQNQDNKDNKKEFAQYKEYQISKPITYKNLTVFLIHGENKIKDKNIMTLQEALKKKKVKVIETSNVNELEIENNSNEKVFIMSGDIVKGGKQDRVIQYDYVLKPKSGKTKLASFCVEQGRWNQRGNEEASKFGSSSESIATKELKMSVRKEKSQNKVWENVDLTQKKLAKKINKEVTSDQSKTSLQLTLENKDLNKATKEYIKEFKNITKKHDDVIGYAFAINGKINSTDIYASNILFKKLWPKLIKSSVVEAIGEYKKDQKYKDVGTEDIIENIEKAEKTKKEKKKIQKINEENTVIEAESEEIYLNETKDSSKKSWRRNYLNK